MGSIGNTMPKQLTQQDILNRSTELQKMIQNLAAMRTTVRSLGDDVTAAETRIRSLRTEIGTQEQDIVDTEKAINKMVREVSSGVEIPD